MYLEETSMDRTTPGIGISQDMEGLSVRNTQVYVVQIMAQNPWTVCYIFKSNVWIFQQKSQPLDLPFLLPYHYNSAKF